MKAVMLVGGLGTRLRPLTLETKKELMPVANRPFLEHVLANLARAGVDEVILTTGYLAEAFESFPSERSHGVKLTISRETEPLDTCGAVKNVEHMLDGTFLVLNGDIFTNLDISALVGYHHERETLCTITLTPVEDPSAYGLVPIDDDGRIVRFIEKPKSDQVVTDLINAGTYVLEPQALNYAPAGEPHSFERGLFPLLLAEGEALYGYVGGEYWLDIGTPPKYLRANKDALERRVGLEPPGVLRDNGVWFGRGDQLEDGARLAMPAVLGDGCTVGQHATIGPLSCVGDECRIGSGAVVEESVLHERVSVGDGARIVGSIVAADASIGAGTTVTDAVVGPGVVVGAGNELSGGIRLWPGLTVPDEGITFSR